MSDNNNKTKNATDEITQKLENTTISTDNQSSGNDNTEQNGGSNKNNSEETKAEEHNNNINKSEQTQTKQSSDNDKTNTPSQQLQSQQTVNSSSSVTQQNKQTISSDNKEIEDDHTNLIINYLPPTMGEGTLATLFSPYGSLERCKIVVDLQTLRSRGYGFVKYDNPVSAERALQATNGYELNGKKLKVAFARPQCKAIQNANIYITNIPPNFNDTNLRKLFEEYGKIVECRILKDQNGQSRGVGFVRMDTHHNAIEAVQAVDQHVVDGNNPPLLVKLAQRRVPRRYYQQNRQNQPNQQKKYGNSGGGMGNSRNMNGGGLDKNKNKRNSPNRKYYPKNNYRQSQNGSQMGGTPIGGNDNLNNLATLNNNIGPATGSGGNGGGNGGGSTGKQNNSPAKRGYYRPRQQQFKPNQPKQQNYQQRQRGAPNQNQGPPYFPAPMYDAPYQPMQYAQPAYAANIHMAAAAMNNPPNPNAVDNTFNYNYN